MSHRASASLAVLMMLSANSAAEPGEGDGSALQLFEERIMPIFRSPKPSSCVQCHLSSVDIKDYILPSHQDTFLALRAEGLIDVATPEKSKILKLIRMGDQDLDKGARLVHEKTRMAEHEAFSSWIEACCSDPKLRDIAVPADARPVGPQKPIEVVRHARKSRVVESFARNVWSQRMRCFPCHTPHALDENNPKHKIPIQKQGEFVKKFGLKMNIFHETPEETMDQLIASSRRPIPGRYPLINLEDPKNSLLILKPTSKLPPKDDSGRIGKPSSKNPVSHMGGLKMHVNDQSYKTFMAWINDYAKVVGNDYVAVDDLPPDNWVPTQRILRLRDIPESWGDLTVVQMFVHARDEGSDAWSAEAVAFTQSLITPRRMVNGPLLLLRKSLSGSPPADHDNFPLRPGKHLIKVYVDKDNRIAQNARLMLGSDDFAGQVAINAQWRIGFPKAEVFSAQALAE